MEKITGPEKSFLHETILSLTPNEVIVLRERFGLLNKAEETVPIRRFTDDEDNGSGGVPAPARAPL